MPLCHRTHSSRSRWVLRNKTRRNLPMQVKRAPPSSPHMSQASEWFTSISGGDRAFLGHAQSLSEQPWAQLSAMVKWLAPICLCMLQTGGARSWLLPLLPTLKETARARPLIRSHNLQLPCKSCLPIAFMRWLPLSTKPAESWISWKTVISIGWVVFIRVLFYLLFSLATGLLILSKCPCIENSSKISRFCHCAKEGIQVLLA